MSNNGHDLTTSVVSNIAIIVIVWLVKVTFQTLVVFTTRPLVLWLKLNHSHEDIPNLFFTLVKLLELF